MDQQPDTISVGERALWQFNVISNNKVCLGLHVKCLTLFPDFNHILIFLTDFHISLQYQFHSYLSSWNQNDTCRWTYRHTSMIKAIGVFHDYVNMPKKIAKL